MYLVLKVDSNGGDVKCDLPKRKQESKGSKTLREKRQRITPSWKAPAKNLLK